MALFECLETIFLYVKLKHLFLIILILVCAEIRKQTINALYFEIHVTNLFRYEQNNWLYCYV